MGWGWPTPMAAKPCRPFRASGARDRHMMTSPFRSHHCSTTARQGPSQRSRPGRLASPFVATVLSVREKPPSLPYGKFTTSEQQCQRVLHLRIGTASCVKYTSLYCIIYTATLCIFFQLNDEDGDGGNIDYNDNDVVVLEDDGF